VASQTPFFILGCVRSGTSFLRGVLRRHPDLACPEETHFFRSGDPYGTAILQGSLLNSAVLKKHRELDGISEAEFRQMLERCRSRGELLETYMRRYIERHKPAARRWFDKSPQNVYGAALIAAQFPGARFVHLVRDPRAVVASLRIGNVVKVPELIGACNYWIEAVQIVTALERAFPGSVHELRHEDLIDDFDRELAELMAFLEEPFDASLFAGVERRRRVYDYEQLFSAEERTTITELCGPLAEQYGYALAELEPR